MMEQHPEYSNAIAMLSREEAYSESFTTNERISERLERFRTGLVHIITEILPKHDTQKEYHWLSALLHLLEMTQIDLAKEIRRECEQ